MRWGRRWRCSVAMQRRARSSPRIVLLRHFGTPPLSNLLFLAALSGDYTGALTALKPLLSVRAGPVRPGALEVALSPQRPQRSALRHSPSGRVYPADTMLRFETCCRGRGCRIRNHLAADTERVLTLVDGYFHLAMYEEALRLLAHPYPPLPPEQFEPGAVPPHKAHWLPSIAPTA